MELIGEERGKTWGEEEEEGEEECMLRKDFHIKEIKFEHIKFQREEKVCEIGDTKRRYKRVKYV